MKKYNLFHIQSTVLICITLSISTMLYSINVKVVEIKEGKEHYFIKLLDEDADTLLILSKKIDNNNYTNDTNYVQLIKDSVYDICLSEPILSYPGMFDKQIYTNDSTIMWLGIPSCNNYWCSLAKGVSDLYLYKPLSPMYGYKCTWTVSKWQHKKYKHKNKRKIK